MRISSFENLSFLSWPFWFFSLFWAYGGQPHDHISWAKPMPFASINSTKPRNDPWEFHEKILRIGGAGKWGFFEAAILNFYVGHFDFFFASFHWKMQPISMRDHFFLHYGWFFQNLRKEAVRTFMHTTVDAMEWEFNLGWKELYRNLVIVCL